MIQSICEVCQTPFLSKRKRRCCTRQCSAKLALIAKGKNPWQFEEMQILEEEVGQIPIAEIVSRVQRLDRRKKWPIRTETSIRVKIKRMGERLKCVLDNFTCGEFARLLGVNRDRVESWCEKYGLPYRKVDGYKGAIRLKDFRKWAYRNPQKLAGIDKDALTWALEDAGFAEHCSNLPLPTQGRPQPVKDLNTGKVYSSMKAASRASYVDPGGVRQAVYRKGQAGGKNWSLLNQTMSIPERKFLVDRQNRIDACNLLLETIAGCGRKFFSHEDRIAYFEMDDRRHRIWFIDAYSKKRIYLHSGRWKGFTNGGTLKRLVEHLKDYIMTGQQLQQELGPFPQWLCNGDLWGYGEDMELVRQKAIDLGIYREPLSVAAVEGAA